MTAPILPQRGSGYGNSERLPCGWSAIQSFAMPMYWFTPAVKVETGIRGRGYAVTNVQRAAELLLSWRHVAGPKWKIAVRICTRCLDGEIPANEVREPFRDAAREAGKLLED